MHACLTPLSHWAATVDDKLRTAFAREFPKCLGTFAGVLNFLAWVAVIRSHVTGICDCFEMFKKFVKQIFSQNSHGVVAGASNPSRIHLNLVSVSQKVREIWDKFVRDWRPMKLNYDWLETKMGIWHSGRESRASVVRLPRECRTTTARDSRYMYANSRRTLAIFTAIFVRHTQMCREVLIQCDSKWKLSFIRNFVSPTSRQQSQPSEILVWMSWARPCENVSYAIFD